MSVTYRLFDHSQDEPLAELDEDEIGSNDCDAQGIFERLWEVFLDKNIDTLYNVWVRPYVWVRPEGKDGGWMVVLSYDGDHGDAHAHERPLSELKADMKDHSRLLKEMVISYYHQEHPDFEGMRIEIEKTKRQKLEPSRSH
jgi:hypothetical protein